MSNRKSLAERFAAKCGPLLENGCIEWQASKLKGGYGHIRPGGCAAHDLAHRVAYELAKGPIKDGQIVMHTCDNPSCVNPDHLVAGTSKQNTADMVSKKRHGWREKTPWQKLSRADAKRIIDLRMEGMTQQKIADMYQVSRPLISLLENGKLQYSLHGE